MKKFLNRIVRSILTAHAIIKVEIEEKKGIKKQKKIEIEKQEKKRIKQREGFNCPYCHAFHDSTYYYKNYTKEEDITSKNSYSNTHINFIYCSNCEGYFGVETMTYFESILDHSRSAFKLTERDEE